MVKNKKLAKIEIAEKNDLKYFVLSTSNLNLGNVIFEANKEYCIDKKTAELLKESIFYKKWSLKVIEK